MSKFDKQLSRMNFLMEYNMPKNEVKSNIEYHANGADGNVYGILKEGSKYYIKKTVSGKENIAESYDYLNGFNNRKENEYKSYNDATKHLELKLMSLNEAYGKHEDVSTVDFKKNEKVLSQLTEDARKELNRMNQIFENSDSNNIKSGKVESNCGAGNGEPFTEKVDKSEKAHTDGPNTTAKNAKDTTKKDGYTDAKVPSEKEGGMLKEGLLEDPTSDFDMEDEDTFDDDLNGIDSFQNDDDELDDMYDEDEYSLGDDEIEDSDIDEPVMGDEDDIVGIDTNDDEDFDDILEEYEQAISGDYEELTGPGSDNKNNAIATWERVDEGCDDENGDEEEINEDAEYNPAPKEGNQAMDGPKGSGKHIATWDRVTGKQSERLEGSQALNEAINKAVNRIMNKYGVNETIEEKIQRLVNEEVTKLDAWGKHPRFRKQPMKLPQNKEVMAGTADRDWNDDSAKGEQPYGLKVGDGAPFNKTVEMLTDSALSQLKESLGLKKK